MRISGVEMEQALAWSDCFVCIDLETTGFSLKKGAEILELAAILVDPVNRRIVKKMSTFVKPQLKKIPAKITEITSITNEMVKDAPGIDTVLPEFIDFIKEYPLVFHNAGFDWDRFLDPMIQRLGIVLKNQVIDTLVLAGVCLPEQESRKLEALSEYFGYQSADFHRAIEDARATAAIAVRFRDMLREKHGPPRQQQTLLLEDESFPALPPLRIGRIGCWAKGKYRRIYLATNWGNIFYDLDLKKWLVKELRVEKSVDLSLVEKGFLAATKLPGMQAVSEYFEEQTASVAS